MFLVRDNHLSAGKTAVTRSARPGCRLRSCSRIIMWVLAGQPTAVLPALT